MLLFLAPNDKFTDTFFQQVFVTIKKNRKECLLGHFTHKKNTLLETHFTAQFNFVGNGIQPYSPLHRKM